MPLTLAIAGFTIKVVTVVLKLEFGLLVVTLETITGGVAVVVEGVVFSTFVALRRTGVFKLLFSDSEVVISAIVFL